MFRHLGLLPLLALMGPDDPKGGEGKGENNGGQAGKGGTGSESDRLVTLENENLRLAGELKKLKKQNEDLYNLAMGGTGKGPSAEEDAKEAITTHESGDVELTEAQKKAQKDVDDYFQKLEERKN